MRQDRILFISVALIYLLATAFLLFSSAPPISLDMLYYYSIARKYSSGEFYHALNGYWAPLLPWLLTLVFKTGVFWRALQIVNLLAGLLLIFYSVRMARLLKLSRLSAWLMIVLIGGLTMVHQLESTTPDFLSVTCLVAFLYYFYQRIPTKDFSKWYKVAISALLLIFCKAFYFYFVLAFLLGYWIFWSVKTTSLERLKYHSFFLKIIGLTVAVYALWITALSLKYDRFIFSATGSYNAAIMTPKGPGLQYYTCSGLVAPKCRQCLGNEDYTLAAIKSRNPFESKQAFQYQVDIYSYNATILWYLFSYFSYFKWLILFLPILLWLYYQTSERDTAIGLFGAGCLILFGYFLVFYEDRYVLPVLYCFIFASFYYFDRLYPFVLLFLIPFVAFAKNGVHTFHLWKENRTASHNRSVYEVTDRLIASKLFEGKRIANASDAFGSTYLSMLALKSSTQYYGELGIFYTHTQNWEDLQKYKIEYLFYFDCAGIDEKGNCIDTTLPFYLKDKQVVYKDSSARLTAYKLF
jgi:hypothetical protein